jgi:transposase
MDDATTRLLGLDGLAVTGVEDGLDGPVVHLVTADEAARRCPECGTRARRSKGRRVTHPRDLKVGDRRPKLLWRKRRWCCDEQTRNAARLSDQHLAELQADLKLLTKRIGVPIRAAWNAKEDLLELLALARTHPGRRDVFDLLYQFYHRCGESRLPELERLTTTVQTW